MKKQFHAITSGQQTKEEVIRIARSINPYIDFLHIREKNRTAREVASLVRGLKDTGFPANKILVNDRVDVAAVFRTAGAQLTHSSLNVCETKRAFHELLIGASIHSKEEAVSLVKSGADFLIYGNVFTTASKVGKPGVGLEKLEELVNVVTVPVIGIGGIKPEHVTGILSTGAAGIAVLSGVFLADDPVRSAKAYREQLDREGVH
ncbi:thiamine phosphate synthase [Rossellomorea aquimaris]|uniref:thiamine phosphate synthase n=1 Tax=Rossellomorea aquimaris TaxID=189382 RepID=UPI001CD55A2D|nr:thiamine phosphate synthase [Rossellomorea aquimaris]MCA1053873.1 thiamine phosphate synthase [Rossellomorea aquimaris]